MDSAKSPAGPRHGKGDQLFPGAGRFARFFNPEISSVGRRFLRTLGRDDEPVGLAHFPIKVEETLVASPFAAKTANPYAVALEIDFDLFVAGNRTGIIARMVIPYGENGDLAAAALVLNAEIAAGPAGRHEIAAIDRFLHLGLDIENLGFRQIVAQMNRRGHARPLQLGQRGVLERIVGGIGDHHQLGDRGAGLPIGLGNGIETDKPALHRLGKHDGLESLFDIRPVVGGLFGKGAFDDRLAPLLAVLAHIKGVFGDPSMGCVSRRQINKAMYRFFRSQVEIESAHRLGCIHGTGDSGSPDRLPIAIDRIGRRTAPLFSTSDRADLWCHDGLWRLRLGNNHRFLGQSKQTQI